MTLPPSRDPAQHRADVHVLLDGNRGAQPALLLGRRRGNPAWEGYCQLPSGSLGPGEPLRDGAARELKEKTGVTADPATLRMLHISNHRGPYGTDRAGFFFAAQDWTDTGVSTEPELCEGREWWDPGALTAPLPPYLAEALGHAAHGRRHSEFGWTAQEATP
ncbi:NUDIX domain-containing protein [Streptomyces sp. NPDC001674]|uniref:NUDIX domain-containing protein n=1 Tax=Streptomyces sp. NPDC001674 TaxID=3154394 RepID=UPI00332F9551